ncbi:hypothetical protein PCASD_02905 [Puccinia coronata f. sp. avenae]|uniref:Uncharacterized protein n=1 Tax=Puccinia coronata f. sp. avenae TaxID=200324 RepID=A0A2N5VEG8_9BASI|nr:hypothetical protein PCASD_02905 [Puccinia coronata f. sp. avenae]
MSLYLEPVSWKETFFILPQSNNLLIACAVLLQRDIFVQSFPPSKGSLTMTKLAKLFNPPPVTKSSDLTTAAQAALKFLGIEQLKASGPDRTPESPNEAALCGT